MKAKISRLSKGIFDKVVPELELSAGKIEGAMCTDGVLSGSFLLKSRGGQEAKGFLYTDTGRITLKETSFIGEEAKIHYEISGRGMAAGDKLKGTIFVVSDGGELRLPCEVQIEAPFAMTSMGKIRNLFHFANLVKNHYDEAKRLFLSEDFADIFLPGNPHARAVYEGLKKSVCPDTAMDEFLVSVNKKSRVFLSIPEDRIEYMEFSHSLGGSITLTKSGWGYLPIEAEADGEFLRLEKTALSSEDFSGSVYQLAYTVEESMVHAGRNYGRILIRTPYQELSAEVYVDRCHTLQQDKRQAARELKDGIQKLAGYYFSFRLHDLNTEAWCKKSLKLIGRLRGRTDEPLFLELLQIHLTITQKKGKDAGFLLRHVEDRVLRVKDGEPDLYAYYLYVRVLYLRDSRVLKETLLTVRRLYESGNDSWRILWILLYLDEEFAQNKSLKLVRLKEQYAKGDRSPFLYYEACVVMNEQPELIRVLNGFELQFVWWGVKKEALTEKAGLQVAELCFLEKHGKPILYRILGSLYEKYKNKIILDSLLALLIRDGRIEERYYRWYEEGVRLQCSLTGLYEAYIEARPAQCREPIPKIVAMYFAFDNSLNACAKEKLYENMLRGEQENSPVLLNHMPAIEQFAVQQITKGNVSRKLAYIYKRSVKPELLTQAAAKAYARILLTACIDMGKRQGRVVVRHKECSEEFVVPIAGGEAYAPIYTEDAAVLYEDGRGRRFLIRQDRRGLREPQGRQEEVEPAPLFHEEAMVRSCCQLGKPERGDIFLWMHICEKEGMYRSGREDVIDIYKRAVLSPLIMPYYKNQLCQRIIEYYMENYDGDKLEEQLSQLDMSGMPARDRVKLIELLIARGMYEEAYQELKQYGYEEISVNRLMKLCVYLLWAREEGEDVFLVELCARVFFKGKYDETILRYLLRYYCSTTKLMLELWQAARDFSVDTLELEERLIAQMLFSGSYADRIMDVFGDYYQKSVNQVLISAYLSLQSHEYFVHNLSVSPRLFSYIEQEYRGHRKDTPDICGLALLRHYSEQSSLAEAQVKLAGTLLEEFTEGKRCFGFYKKLERYLELPPYLRDKTAVEYQGAPDREVEIHYMLDTGISARKVYEIRKMDRAYESFYVMEFILFYGERLQYYITESGQGSERMTEQDTILMDRFGAPEEESRYRLLNDICASMELKDSATLKELMRSYAEKKRLAEDGFAIL